MAFTVLDCTPSLAVALRRSKQVACFPIPWPNFLVLDGAQEASDQAARFRFEMLAREDAKNKILIAANSGGKSELSMNLLMDGFGILNEWTKAKVEALRS